jgi:hypothetical protein
LFALAALVESTAAQNCGPSTGRTPLTDLGAGTYLGFEGGLYSGGANTPPAGHLASALAEAALVVPRDASGAPEPACGLIGMLSIGMSNTTHEFAVLERDADALAAHHPRLVIFNAAQGGQSADLIQNPNAPYWTLVQERVNAVGLSNAQVQVAWLKEAFSLSTPYSGFPSHAASLEASLELILQKLRDMFPNLRLVYMSSRIYGGYGGSEPVSYEGGFAYKWLIEQQIAGDPALNWNPASGAVESPLVLWGPYLWADGGTPRGDGLTWCPADLESDGTHPSPLGEQKVADLLAQFFASDATAQPWFANPGLAPLEVVDANADATVLSSAPNQNHGATSTLRIEGQTQTALAYVRFDVSAVERPVLHAKLSLRNPENNLNSNGFAARIVADSSWSELSITYANAPAASGASVMVPQQSRDGARSLDVTDWVNADVDGVITIQLAPGIATAPATLLHSRESAWAPRLVLSTRPGAWVETCAGGTTTHGCVAQIAASGFPSASNAGGFVLRATSVEGQRLGLVFYGASGGAAIPWGASTLCVAGPRQRTPAANSGGTDGACDGSLALDWLDYLATHPGSLAAPATAGTVIDAQTWFRDPPAPKTTNLSGALRFTLCP